MDHAARVTATIDRVLAFGAGNVMREEEAGAGFTVLRPGDRPWLPIGDWPQDIVVSTDERVVRIIAIYALHPGQGAFRRMVDGIQAAGLKPIVVEPMGDKMPAILQRWGWKFRRKGWGYNAYVVAYPSERRK